jgi:hypothetical protein
MVAPLGKNRNDHRTKCELGKGGSAIILLGRFRSKRLAKLNQDVFFAVAKEG